MDKSVLINDYERVDDLQRGGLHIIQDPAHFCFGLDAVMLAGFVELGDNTSVLDLCTGSGVIPLLLSSRYPRASFCGLEIQPESADMARRSVMLNMLENRITVTCGDIKNADSIYKPASFDAITVNPPYIKANTGLTGENAIARHELLCGLDDVVKSAARLLRPGGSFFMVHRPKRLADIMKALYENRLGPGRLRFVAPYTGREPRLLLIEAVRGKTPELKVMPELAVYNADGKYTDEVSKIYFE